MNLFEFSDYAKAECGRVCDRLPVKKSTDLRFAFLSDLHYKAIDSMRVAISNIVQIGRAHV